MIDTRFYTAISPTPLATLIAGLDVKWPEKAFLDEKISGLADLKRSRPGDIAFLGSKKNLSALDKARATACFVPENLASEVGARHIVPIISSAPRAHFGRVISKLVTEISLGDTNVKPIIDASAKIASQAVLGAGCEIGAHTHITPYAVIGPGVKIGSNCYIGPHTHIEFTLMGDSCQIKSGAVIGGRGFGVDADEAGIADLPHIGRVIIGDRVSIGSQTTLDRGFVGDTVLGDDVKIDNHVQIAHNVEVGDGTMIAGQVGVSGSCIIGKNVLLGGAVGLADHINIGDGAKLAARSGVMHDVPAGEMWSGYPALPIRDHMRIVSATRKLIKQKKS